MWCQELGTGLEGLMSRLISMLAIAVAAVPLVAGAAHPVAASATPASARATATDVSPPSGVEAQVVTLMNADRAHNGLNPLTVDPAMSTVARGWADVVMGRGALSHNPDIVNLLPEGWTRWGENVGFGPSPTSLEAAFMASPEHRANILGPFSIVGVGVSVASDGTLWVAVDFVALHTGVAAVSCSDTNPPSTPAPAAASGYFVLGGDGGVFTFGSAVFRGSVPGLGVRARTVLMALTPDAGGYWVLGTDGGVFTFGDALFLGSVPGIGSTTSAVDLKPTPSGRGYWVLGRDGSVFTFGDAPMLGSLPSSGIRDQAVKLIPTPSGQGYWILGVDGGIFTFGDARFRGSLPGSGVADASVSMAST